MHEEDNLEVDPYVLAAHITGTIIAVEPHTYPNGHVVHSAFVFNPVAEEYVPAG